MCGICGKIYLDSSREIEPRLISEMCRTIVHRGPDDSGTYVDRSCGLGSTRLSILDLAGGHMPISNEDDSIWIVYNGEVYNSPSLREELTGKSHRFKTTTDTEVLLHLYEEEGIGFPKRLNGMFAFAIWDLNLRRLVLGRDHVGIKPLFYCHLADRVVFGSEVKPILCDSVPKELDIQAFHDYLSLNYVPGPRTIFSGIRKLPPGHTLLVDVASGQVEEERFWDYPAPAERTGGLPKEEDLVNDLHALLRQVISDTMLSDVPVGAFLSGGIDSSLAVGLMSEVSSSRIKTFSMGFQEESYNELPYARMVARKFDTEHHELVIEPDAFALVSSMTDFFDEPFADNSALAVFALAEFAAKDVKVVLAGDGGDEVFAGYYTYQADKIASYYRRLPRFLGAQLIPAMVGLLPTSHAKASFDFKLKRFMQGAMSPPLPAHFAWKAYLSEDMKHGLYSDSGPMAVGRSDLSPTVALFQQAFDRRAGEEDLLNRILYVDSKIQLVDDMLTKVDRMSMAHSLEVRVPLLDLRLIDFMAQLPGSYKLRRMTLKYLLKKVAARVIPREIIDRPKAGFTIPVATWLAGDLRPMVDDYLSEGKLRQQGLLKPEAVRAMIQQHNNGQHDFSRSIWTLLLFSVWFDRHF